MTADPVSDSAHEDAQHLIGRIDCVLIVLRDDLRMRDQKLAIIAREIRHVSGTVT